MFWFWKNLKSTCQWFCMLNGNSNALCCCSNSNPASINSSIHRCSPISCRNSSRSSANLLLNSLSKQSIGLNILLLTTRIDFERRKLDWFKEILLEKSTNLFDKKNGNILWKYFLKKYRRYFCLEHRSIYKRYVKITYEHMCMRICL